MAAWWISEAIPLAATSLLPIVLLPLLGVASPAAASAPYASDVIFLFAGGFVLGLAMERWGLHRRIALSIISLVGTRPPALVAGFMLATALLSAFVSNTATAVMLLPIAVSILGVASTRLRDSGGDADGVLRKLGPGLLLGIAYAASIGGVATINGTPPNGILIGNLNELLGIEVGYARWLMIGLPMAAVMLPLAWALLVFVLYRVPLKELPGGRSVIREELRAMGRPGRGEVIVLVVFALTGLGWVFRPLITEALLARGVLPEGATLSDSTIAIVAALALFIIPVRPRRLEMTMNWETAVRLPWGVLLLFGGGLSLAAAISASGLDSYLGSLFGGLRGTNPVIVVLLVCLVVKAATEVASNTAVASALLPVLAAAGPVIGVHPALLMVPAAISASFAFMLPVATPPNAVIFGSGRVAVRQMAAAGLWLNLIAAVVATALCVWLVPLVLGLDGMRVPPTQAAPAETGPAPAETGVTTVEPGGG